MKEVGRRPLGLALVLLAAAVTASAQKAAVEAPAGPRTRLIRSWPEDVKVGKQQMPGRVEIWFDYAAGTVTQRIVADAPDGTTRIIKSEEFAPGINTPRPSPEEIAEAMSMVQADFEMAGLIRGAEAAIDGGFQIFEPRGKACGPGSRCLKVQLMTKDRKGLIRNVIVDLAKEGIVYRSWTPTGPGGTK